MPDYNLGKVYKIECLIDGNDDIYIGSTCEPYLSNRFGGHKAVYKRFLNGKGTKKVSSFKVFDKYDVENCVITLIELYSCKSREELIQRERHYITTLDCVNTTIPLRTVSEWKDVNKDLIKEKSKEYVIKNKEKLKQRHKKYYDANKEKYKNYYEANNERRIANKDKILEKGKIYYEKNKVKISEQKKIFYKAKKEKNDNEIIYNN